MTKNAPLIVLLVIVGLVVIVGLIPIEKTIPKSVPYQEAIYKTVEKTIYVQKSETRYNTENVTRYLYYGTLKNTAGSIETKDEMWTFDNVISWNKEYFRQGGSPEYTFMIININGTKSYYYDIDW